MCSNKIDTLRRQGIFQMFKDVLKQPVAPPPFNPRSLKRSSDIPQFLRPQPPRASPLHSLKSTAPWTPSLSLYNSAYTNRTAYFTSTHANHYLPLCCTNASLIPRKRLRGTAHTTNHGAQNHRTSRNREILGNLRLPQQWRNPSYGFPSGAGVEK